VGCDLVGRGPSSKTPARRRRVTPTEHASSRCGPWLLIRPPRGRPR
jgi:hypothetical protein